MFSKLLSLERSVDRTNDAPTGMNDLMDACRCCVDDIYRVVTTLTRRMDSPEHSRQIVQELLDRADITINGDRPEDIQIHNEGLYQRVLTGGSIALGEAYMDDWWECGQLDEFFSKALRANLHDAVKSPEMLVMALRARLFNRQDRLRALEVGEVHYDLGNDLFGKMLDKRMVYTCGYWSDGVDTLDEAQEAKLELVCQKLDLKPGMTVLDIGCGWGSFAKYAAERHGVKVVGITISKEQAELARELCDGADVEIMTQDYRETEGQFDRIASLGMFEHVGVKNYREYMKVVSRCLREDGLFLLHTIGGNESRTTNDPWIDKYIFPNSMLPSLKQIDTASEGVFKQEHWENLGPHYDKTLMAWFYNFDEAWQNTPELREKYGERFYRMWKYYLLSCAGTFRARKNQLWQIVLSKKGVLGGYNSIK